MKLYETSILVLGPLEAITARYSICVRKITYFPWYGTVWYGAANDGPFLRYQKSEIVPSCMQLLMMGWDDSYFHFMSQT